MKTLNLYRIWEILNFINEQEDNINERGIYPCLLGQSSSYCNLYSFHHLLQQYYFRVDEDSICIFNDDGVPYEDFTNNDFSYIPKKLLEFDEDQIREWIDEEVKNHLKQEAINNEDHKAS
mgnify:CR=1 FL=1